VIAFVELSTECPLDTHYTIQLNCK